MKIIERIFKKRQNPIESKPCQPARSFCSSPNESREPNDSVLAKRRYIDFYYGFHCPACDLDLGIGIETDIIFVCPRCGYDGSDNYDIHSKQAQEIWALWEELQAIDKAAMDALSAKYSSDDYTV